MSDNPSGFVECLRQLDKNADTAVLAKLRRGLGASFDQVSSEVSPWLAPFVHNTDNYGKFALVGNLFAHHRMHTQERETLGTAFAGMGRSDSLEKRFKSLLAARNDEIIARLREAIGLAKSHEVAINYHTLLWNLLDWENPNQPVQFRWAKDYWFDAALLAPWKQEVEKDLENEAALRKAAKKPEQKPSEKDIRARMFAKYLQSLQKNRAALAGFRRGLDNSLGNIDMLPYIASFLPEDRLGYPAYFLTAALFGLHPLSTETAYHDMGRVFRFLAVQQPGKEATQSLQRRFTALLDANRRDIAHHLRQAIAQAKSARNPVAINYRRLLLDLIDWDNADKFVQRRWARHFFFEPKNEGA